jgi:hypothetical protein
MVARKGIHCYNKSMNKQQTALINTLRVAYGEIERIDPASDTYKSLKARLAMQSTEVLKVLADAKIKWVSRVAQDNIVARMNAKVIKLS